MLKYFVVAVFSMCVLPCLANAQSGSRAVEAMAAPVMATPDMGSAQVMSGGQVHRWWSSHRWWSNGHECSDGHGFLPNGWSF